MSFHSRRFERRLRPAVRRAVKSSKALRKEFKRRRVTRVRRLNIRPVLWVLAPALFVAVRAASDYDPHFSSVVVALLILFVCGRVFTQAMQLVQSLFASHELGVAYHLPVYELEFFRVQFRHFLFQSVGILAAFLAVYLARHTEWNAPDVPLAAGLGAALLGWLLYVALCLLAARYGLRYGTMPGYAFYAVAAALFLAEFSFHRPVPPAHVAAMVLPAGWGEAAYAQVAGGRAELALVMLLASVALLEVGRRNFLWLRTTFLQALTTPPLPQMVVTTPDAAGGAEVSELAQASPPAAAEESPDWTEWAQAQRKLLAAKASDRLRQGALQVVVDWEAAGPIEGIAAKWFRDRERMVAEFLLGEQIGWWTQQWTRSAYVCIGVLVGSLVPVIPVWALVLAAFVSLFLGAPATGGQWLGFTHLWSGTTMVPMLAVFPVGYREVSRAMIKANLLRVLAWAPLGLLMGLAVGWRAGDAGRGAALALATLFLLLVAQPVLAAGRFSHGTRVGYRNVRSYFYAAAGVTLLIPFVLGAIVFWFLFAFGDWLHTGMLWLVGVPLVPLSAFIWWWYGWVFHRGRIDHVAPQQQGLGHS